MFDTETGDALHARIADQIAELPPPPWTLIGEGLWGTVHDLGDGTVLKIVRRHGGLGTGEAKLAREVAALTLLDGLSTPAVRVARLVAHGSFENAYAGTGPALAGWLRSERLSGRAVDEGGLWGLAPAERERLGEDIGAALAAFHEAATARAGGAAKFGDSLARGIDEALQRIGNAQQRAQLERLKEMWRVEAGETVFQHGDAHLSNMPRSPRAPTGLVDLAEAGLGWREADLRHFESAGTLRDAVFRGYAAVSGAMPDLRRYRMAVAANAAVTLAIEGESGHPREAMRRRAWLDEALRQAGVEA